MSDGARRARDLDAALVLPATVCQYEIEKTIHDVGLIDVADAVKVGCLFVDYEREEGEQAVERHDEDDPNDLASLIKTVAPGGISTSEAKQILPKIFTSTGNADDDAGDLFTITFDTTPFDITIL